MKSPPAGVIPLLLLTLVIFEQQFGHLCFAAHAQNDKSTADGTTTAPVTESVERGETERWRPFLQFSPIWLEESTRGPVIMRPINTDDDGVEAIVVENKYSNNNENEDDVREFQSQEFPKEDQVVHLDEDQLDDENEEDDEEEGNLEDDDVTIHESIASEEKLTGDLPAETKDIPPEQVDVKVKNWNEPLIQPLASTNENAIDSANAVSAPWYDVMAMGLPPSVAYNWQFLMDLSAKLRTAPRSRLAQASTTDSSGDSGEYNARLKYILTRVQDVQSTQSSPVKLDNLKQQHLLKTKLSSYNHNSDDDILMWAWRRAVPVL